MQEEIFLEFKEDEPVIFNDLSYYVPFLWKDEIFLKVGSYIACNLKQEKVFPVPLGQVVLKVKVT